MKDRYPSKEAFRNQIRRIIETNGQCEDSRTYLPKPEEIEMRKHEVRWLNELGFHQEYIESIMQYDMPSPKKIEQMLKTYSVEEVMEIIEPLIITRDYGRS